MYKVCKGKPLSSHACQKILEDFHGIICFVYSSDDLQMPGYCVNWYVSCYHSVTRFLTNEGLDLCKEGLVNPSVDTLIQRALDVSGMINKRRGD